MRSLILLIAASTLAAQQSNNQPRNDSTLINQSRNPLISSFRFRSIGPASMGGRIDDIEAAPSDPNVIYVGYATGGVWKSENNGTSFEPVFETYGSASIGDIAVDPSNPNTVYVGTGEPNNRQTSTFGDGIYKSTDGGKTFTRLGLRETQTIARIVVDPRHPEVVYVASPGHLFGPSPERGIYKTTDGGKSWDKIKYVDENTGFTDLAIDPSNSNVLYAASYQRRRLGCCFNGGGPGSAIWKTEDGGRSWNKLTGNGLPQGNFGRIALDVSRSKPNVVYAQIETAPLETDNPAGRGGAYDWCNNAGPGRGFGGGRGAGGAPPGGGEGAAPAAAAAPPDTNRTPPALDPNRSGVFRSDNKGRSWTAVSNCNARPSYFSQIRIDPTNDAAIWVGGVHPAKSLDGGKTFLTLDNAGGFFNMMEDNHAIWIDPRNPNHILRGSDAGLSITWDQGKTWEYVRTMATALAYWVSADMGHPYYVYTGLQDNDSWVGPSATRSRIGIQNHDWFHLGGGDGFQTAVDPTDFRTVYVEQQDGNVSRFDLRTGRSQSIRPVAPSAGRGGAGAPAPEPSQSRTCVDGRITAAAPAAGGGGRGGGRGGTPNVLNAKAGDAYRFNWNTPLLLSPHNPNIVWLAGNRVFRSYNRGESWLASADLTKQIDRCAVDVMGASGAQPQISKNDGVSSFSTITALAESPVMPGVVWAGTDDGNLQVSRDGGETFTEVAGHITGLPAGALTGNNPYWISRIDASHFDAATAYVAIDGHRADDLHPYIFVTHDYGRTFQTVSGNLSEANAGNVQVVREDPKNRNLLYAGTEFGLFISLDGGKTWDRFMNNYPTVRTDDILIHPRDGDLIVASHGRSLWIADDITPLQQWSPAVAAEDVTLFDVRPAIAYLFDYRTDADIGGAKQFAGENAPRGTAINYYLKGAAMGDVKVSILDGGGRALCTSTAPGTPGVHRVQWTLVEPLTQQRAQQGGGAGGGAGGGRGGAGQPDASCSGGAGGARGGAAPAVAPGTYVVKLTVNGRDYVKPVQVLEDKWMFER